MISGIYSIPFSEYAAIPALSNTALGKIAQAPAVYKHWKDSGDQEQSEALRLGRIIHARILEPERYEAEFANTYAVQPETYMGKSIETKEPEMKPWTYQAKACKQWRKDVEEEGLEVITKKQEEMLAGMAAAIAAHPIAGDMFASGDAEKSIVSEYNGIPIKARTDWLRPDKRTIVDLKSAESAEPREFYWNAIRARRYYAQAAFYLDAARSIGLEYEHVCIVAVEKKAPFLVSCHYIEPDHIEEGRQEYQRLLGKYVECQRNNNWPGYEEILHAAPSPRRWKELNQQLAA